MGKRRQFRAFIESLLVTPPEMKQWPWMRDLPVRMWVGRGWVQTPEGLRPITTSCPAPGAQIFEGKGQVNVARKKRKFSEHASSIGIDEQNLDIPKQLESSQAPEPNEPIATCGAVVQYASGTCTAAAQGLQNRGKRMIHVSSKQSGVPGVNWNSVGEWTASWYEEKKQKVRHFHVRHFMKTGKTYSEAEADALRAAIEFRKGLERSGIAKAKREEKPQSGVKGINWNSQKKGWEVQLQINGKHLRGGTFKPKDSTPEEVERARSAAVESRRRLEEKYFIVKQSEGPDLTCPVERKSRVTGVCWKKGSGEWKVCAKMKGNKIDRHFTPLGNTPEDIENARLAAIKCLQNWKRRICKAGSPRSTG